MRSEFRRSLAWRTDRRVTLAVLAPADALVWFPHGSVVHCLSGPGESFSPNAGNATTGFGKLNSGGIPGR